MDTGSQEIEVQVRSYISYFEDAFPWHHDLCQEIERRRALLTDQLLFDVLLSLGGIREPDTLYPPRDLEQLEQLLDAISTSTYDQLKRDCVVYFLLKWYQDGREIKFQYSRSIPPQFTALSDAYWFLDAGIAVQKAVTLLADHRLVTDNASKIILALHYSDDPANLVVKYVRTAKPRLVEQDDIAIYTLALAEKHLHEAWRFQRSFNEDDETRPKLVRKLLEWAVTPEPRAEPLSHLVGLPMSPYEQALLHAYALHPPPGIPPKSVAVLQDLVCVRLIETGQYAEAVKMDRQFTSVSPLKGQHLTQDRAQMVRDIYNALPQVERAVLDLELEIQDKAMANGGDVSMSNSWEDLRPLAKPKPTMNGHTSPEPTAAADRSFGFRVIPSASLTKSLNKSSGPSGRKSLGSNPFASSISSNIATVQQPLASTSSQISPTMPRTFESASQRVNAFFQPTKNTPRRSIDSPFTLSNNNGTANGNGHIDVDMDADEEEAPQDQDQDVIDEDEPMQPLPPLAPPSMDMFFSKSVFDSLPDEPALSRPKPTKGRQSMNGIHKPPPKMTEVQQMKRSIPGGFMDADEDYEEEEGREELAPLPSPSKRNTRKARSSVSVESTEGRRRSSRLSAVPPPEPVSAPKRKAASTSVAKTTSRKKRS